MTKASLRRKVLERAASAVLLPKKLIMRSLSDCENVEGSPVRIQPVLLRGCGTISFEVDVKLGVSTSPHLYRGYAYLEARQSSAKISIGQGSWINNNVVIIAEHKSIRIGKHVLIGTGVEIFDSDFHGLAPRERRLSKASWAASVVLMDNVFLGNNVRVLKGVNIGENSVVANGSIVTRDLPDNVIAGGIPARVLSSL